MSKMIAEKNGNTWTAQAESMQELIDFTNGVCAKKHSRTNTLDFAGTSNWEEAHKLITEGWRDGMDQISKMSENIGTVVGMYIKKLETEYEVSGEFVDVGRFCAGEPECMVSFREDLIRGPGSRIVKISVNIGMSSEVDKKYAFHRGAAVVALCDALEQAGMVAEVWAVEAVNGHLDQKSILSVPIKKAGERIELDRMAYVFAHASMLRRHIFAWQDGQCEEYQKNLGFGFTYSYPKNLPAEMIEHGEIHVSMIDYNNLSVWQSTESATKWVLQMLSAQGVIVEGVEV